MSNKNLKVSVETVKKNDSKHVFHSWSAQAEINPMPVAGAKGSCFWDFDGKKYLDFSSQLVNANLGHQHPKLIQALHEQLDDLVNIAPSFAHNARSEAARLIAEIAPNGLNKVFFTNGGADANEHAIRMAQHHTGKSKVLAAYRSYHGATSGAICLTGEPRRWSAQTALNNVVHFFGPYAYRTAFNSTNEKEECDRALQHLHDLITLEGPDTIAALILETVVGTNGILVPPQGYLAGVRALCDKFGIVMISDEVMAGFGRCGEWFAVNHWGVTPDLITFAKGVNSGYVPLGGVIISDDIAKTFDHKAYPGGLTYSGHLSACASAVASINIFKEEGVIDYVRETGMETIKPALMGLMEKRECIGEVRGLGFFWGLDLVRNRDTREPLVPFNAKGLEAEPMRKFTQTCLENGLWPFVHFNRVHITPPLTSSVEELLEGIQVIDKALSVLKPYYNG